MIWAIDFHLQQAKQNICIWYLFQTLFILYNIKITLVLIKAGLAFTPGVKSTRERFYGKQRTIYSKNLTQGTYILVLLMKM